MNLIKPFAKSYLFYHADCQDGWFAANFTPDGLFAEAISINYGDEVEYPDDADNIVFVDFCPNPQELTNLLNKITTQNVLILDHHKVVPRLREVSTHPNYHRLHFLIHQKECGASLSYLFKWKEELVRMEKPYDKGDVYTNIDHRNLLLKGTQGNRLVELLRARDLWLKGDLKLVADQLHEGIKISGFTKLNPIDTAHPGQVRITSWIDRGEAIVEYNKTLCEDLAKRAIFNDVVQDMVGNDVHLNIAITQTNIGSKYGEYIYDKHKGPCAVVAVSINGPELYIGLGLRGNTSTNVRRIASYLGGGGHDQASGAKLPKGTKVEDVTKLIIDAIANSVVAL